MWTLWRRRLIPPPQVYRKVRQEVWTDSTPGKADKHMANTNPVIWDTGGIPWWFSGYKLAQVARVQFLVRELGILQTVRDSQKKKKKKEDTNLKHLGHLM